MILYVRLIARAKAVINKLLRLLFLCFGCGIFLAVVFVQTTKNSFFDDICTFIFANNAIFSVGAGAYKQGKNT